MRRSASMSYERNGACLKAQTQMYIESTHDNTEVVGATIFKPSKIKSMKYKFVKCYSILIIESTDEKRKRYIW